MTMPEIIAHAEETFKIEKGDCRRTKFWKRKAKEARIEKLAIKYGHLQKKEVNS